MYMARKYVYSDDQEVTSSEVNNLICSFYDVLDHFKNVREDETDDDDKLKLMFVIDYLREEIQTLDYRYHELYKINNE